MRRGTLILVLALLCVGALPAGPSNGAVDLLQAYEPVLLFHPGEEWAPEPVESFLADARVEKQVATRIVAGDRRAAADLERRLRPRSVLPAEPALPSARWCSLLHADGLCGRASGSVRSCTGGSSRCPRASPRRPGFAAPPKLLVRYWLFYEFDDYHTLHKRLWQAHEADWESISVAIGADGKPQFAAYSQHCSGTVRAWTTVEKRSATHPVAYVALGSHANYFTNAPSSTRFTECLKSGTGGATVTRIAQLAQEKIVDRTGTAHPLGPAGLAGVTPLTIVPLDPATVSWARFPGRWSEGQLLWLGTTPRPFTSVSQGYGPSTPHWASTSIPALWHVDSS